MVSSGMVVPGVDEQDPMLPRQGEPVIHFASPFPGLGKGRCPTFDPPAHADKDNGTATLFNFLTFSPYCSGISPPTLRFPIRWLW
jgi:hypothetical protein